MAMTAQRPHRSQSELDASFFERGGRAEAIDPELRVLYQDEGFLVIDKPADVRMDGNFDITVEKLIRDKLSMAAQELFWVHQLDYATSGALCVALDSCSARRAAECFQRGTARKMYLAVVHGIVRPETMPERAALREGEWKGGAGKRGARVQHRSASTFFDSAVAQLRQRRQQQEAGEEVGGALTAEEEALLTAGRWRLAKTDPAAAAAVAAFHAAAKADKQRAEAARLEGDYLGQQGAPDHGVFRLPGDPAGVFWVDASIAGIKGDFRMRVARPGEAGKQSLTQCEVLQVGRFVSVTVPVALAAATAAATAAPAAKASAPDADGDGAAEESEQGGHGCGTRREESAGPISSSGNIAVVGNGGDDGGNGGGSGRRSGGGIGGESSVGNGGDRSDSGAGNGGGGDGCGNSGCNVGDSFSGTAAVGDSFSGTTAGHEGGKPVTKLLLRPQTGRRHQLRLHTAQVGHPIVGDFTYAADAAAPRMCLHACSLRLHMPAEPGRPAVAIDVSAGDPFLFKDGTFML